MALGDITVEIRPDGWSADVYVAGFVKGGVYNFGMSTRNTPGANTPYLSVTSGGYTTSHGVTTVARTSYLVPGNVTTGPVRFGFGVQYVTVVWVLGTFTDGETITQAGAGTGVGKIVGKQSAAGRLYFTVTSGTFNNTGLITGGSSGATATSTSTVVATGSGAAANAAISDEKTLNSGVVARIAFSEQIFTADTVLFTAPTSGFLVNSGSGGGSQNSNTASGISVVNNSTVDYSKIKVVGDFALEQRRCVDGTVDIEVFVAHQFARNGKPVAQVVVTAIGVTSTHNENGSATVMTKSSRQDGLPVYVVNLDLSVAKGFTRGELVNINFTAYPWVGDSTSVLDSTSDAGGHNYDLKPLKWCIMPKTVVRVSATGNNTSGVASNVAGQATVDASPCLTYLGALTKAQAYNLATYGLDVIDGVEVQLNAGTYNWAKGSHTQTNGYFTLCPHSSTNRAGVIWDPTSTDYVYKYQRFYNMTFARSTNTYMHWSPNTGHVIYDTINVNDTQAQVFYDGDGDSAHDFIDCTSNTTGFVKQNGTTFVRLVRGYTVTATTDFAGIRSCGSAVTILSLRQTGGSGGFWWEASQAPSKNYIIGYCSVLAITDGVMASTGGLTNFAAVNTVVERIGASSSPIAEISSDGINPIYNVFAQNCTFAGQRWNPENNFTVNGTEYTYAFRQCVFDSRGNHRMDLRAGGDQKLIGFWQIDWSVGSRDNHMQFGTGMYEGDFDCYGLRSNFETGNTKFTITQSAGWTTNASNSGTAAGGGDYHPAVGSILLARVPSTEACYPYDLNGVAIPNDGTGDIGALQHLVTYQHGMWFR